MLQWLHGYKNNTYLEGVNSVGVSGQGVDAFLALRVPNLNNNICDSETKGRGKN